MELAGHEPWMIRQLDHFHKIVNRETGEADTCLLEPAAVVVVNLVTVAVPFINIRLAVNRCSE